MSVRRFLLFIPFLAVLGLGGFLWKGLSLDPTELPSALINQPFPTFSVASLHDPQKMITEADLKGKPALVNVWGTWCPACKIEHEHLLNIAQQGVTIIGINYKDDREAAKRWLTELGDPYAMTIFDQEGRLGLDLGVYGAPETYVLDKDGVIKYRHAGPIDDRVWQQLKPLLADHN